MYWKVQTLSLFGLTLKLKTFYLLLLQLNSTSSKSIKGFRQLVVAERKTNQIYSV